MFPAHVFAAIAAVDRPAFDNDWSGFTFYRDHLGAFRTTKASMPAMLTGVAYRNELPFNEFRARRANVSVFRALGQQGYQLRWALPFGYDGRTAPYLNGLDASTWYTIPSPYGSQRDYLAVSAAQLLDLSLFRHAPHDLKASVYNDQQWLLQPRVAARMEVEAAAERAAGDIRFLREFAGRINPGGDAPVYTLLHVIAPHPAVRRGCGLPVHRETPAVLQGQLRRAGAMRVEQCPGTARQTARSRSLRPHRHRRDIRSRIGLGDSR